MFGWVNYEKMGFELEYLTSVGHEAQFMAAESMNNKCFYCSGFRFAPRAKGFRTSTGLGPRNPVHMQASWRQVCLNAPKGPSMNMIRALEF